jgi:hypothetical protein
MDTLHPVALNEQFMARGEYNYQVAGRDSGLTESWSLHCLPEGTLIHRATVSGLIATTQIKQVTHYLMTSDYRPITLEMTQEIEGQLTHTFIQCFHESFKQIIETENEPQEERVTEAPAGYHIFFPPVSTQGFIVQGYDFEVGGKQTLALVSVRVQPKEALPLSVDVQYIDYEHIDSEHEIETPAGQFMCHHFIRHDQHMKQQLWVDDNWITIQWSVPYSRIMKWEYLLTRYQRE